MTGASEDMELPFSFKLQLVGAVVWLESALGVNSTEHNSHLVILTQPVRRGHSERKKKMNVWINPLLQGMQMTLERCNIMNTEAK